MRWLPLAEVARVLPELRDAALAGGRAQHAHGGQHLRRHGHGHAVRVRVRVPVRADPVDQRSRPCTRRDCPFLTLFMPATRKAPLAKG